MCIWNLNLDGSPYFYLQALANLIGLPMFLCHSSSECGVLSFSDLVHRPHSGTKEGSPSATSHTWIHFQFSLFTATGPLCPLLSVLTSSQSQEDCLRICHALQGAASGLPYSSGITHLLRWLHPWRFVNHPRVLPGDDDLLALLPEFCRGRTISFYPLRFCSWPKN